MNICCLYAGWKNVAADELAGANGHLVISGSVTKNKLADGDFYEAYVSQCCWTVKCCRTEANVGADKQLREAAAISRPGSFKCGADIETDVSFTIETDFSMEGISLNAIPFGDSYGKAGHQ